MTTAWGPWPLRLFAPLVMVWLSAAAADPVPAQGDHGVMPMPGGVAATDAGMATDMNHEMGHDEQDAAMTGMGDEALRDPHAYADGYAFDFETVSRPHEADELPFAMLLIDRLEAVRADEHTSGAYDLRAWYGRDLDRAVLKAEGEFDNGRWREGRTELLWGHAIHPYWDLQFGVRHDGGIDPGRGWLAVGVEGLAPYGFELDATAYLGEAGASALRLDGEYDLLLTQRWILQPRVEADAFSKRDAARGQGAGLSHLSAGVRLRYEIRREFAPYIGVEWSDRFGETADLARAAGESREDTAVVAGLRLWF